MERLTGSASLGASSPAHVPLCRLPPNTRRDAEGVNQFLRESAAQYHHFRMQGITRGEGEMRLDQFEKLLRLLEWRHFPHQPLRYILMFRFISGNLFFLQLHTGCLLFYKKLPCLCAAGHGCHRQDSV